MIFVCTIPTLKIMLEVCTLSHSKTILRDVKSFMSHTEL